MHTITSSVVTLVGGAKVVGFNRQFRGGAKKRIQLSKSNSRN